MIIGLVGFIGSGKSTVANYLSSNYEFTKESFASSVKDTLSAIFRWDRELLEGESIEARQWRDTVDTWWATRLNIPHLTPRFAMQNVGTNVLRRHFHDEIWIASLEHKLQSITGNIVITDCRYPNEFKLLSKLNGKIIQINKDKLPDWYNIAKLANQNNVEAQQQLKLLDIHDSETAWVGQHVDFIIENQSTIDALHRNIDQVLKSACI